MVLWAPLKFPQNTTRLMAPITMKTWIMMVVVAAAMVWMEMTMWSEGIVVVAGVTPEENEDIVGSDNNIMPPPSSSITTTSEDPWIFSRNPSASATPSSFSLTSKQGQMSGAVALDWLGDTLSDFTTSFHTSVQWCDQPPVNLTVEQNNAAMEHAQDLETNLSNDQLAALLELFQFNVSIADAYMVIKCELLWKAWMQRKLKLSGITFLGEDHEVL
jgi:hypothetical protein